MTRKPDFFIVGAPKCGTTTLVHSLNQHPDVFMAPNEIHFFGGDLEYRRTPRPPTVGHYLKAFEAGRNKKQVGEKSPWYFLSESAPHEIKSFNPKAKIIVMLRNPVDMIHSLHSEYLLSGHEELSFADALSAEQDRKRGARIPRNADFVEGLFYREVGRYSLSLKRCFTIFGRERVHVIIFDDLKDDLRRVLQGVCRFLDVNDSTKLGLRAFNPNSRPRFSFLNDPPPALLRFTKAAMPIPVRRQLRGPLDWINEKRVPRTPIEPGLRRELQGEFQGDIVEVSALLDRDLTHWTSRP